MIGIIQAETLKLLRHRGAALLVGIVPLALVLLWVIVTGYRLAHGAGPHRPMPPVDAASWVAGTAQPWHFAATSFGRYLIGAFAALAFAGEYGWSTWKLIVPQRSRLSLIAGKYIVVLALPVLAYVLTALLYVAIAALDAAMFGPALPPGITIGALLAAHGAGLASMLVSTLLTIAYASAGAMLLRSTMAGTIAAIALVTLERLAGTFAMLLPKWLLLVLPTAYLDNVASLITRGTEAPLVLPDGVVQLGTGVSIAVLGLWTVGLIALTFVQFTRQDLT